MEMVSTLTLNNVMYAAPLADNWQKSKDKLQPSMITMRSICIFTPNT
jgi:hypothetical protein